MQACIARAECVERPRLLHGGLHALGIVLEFQGVSGLQRSEQLVPRTFIDEEIDVLLRGDASVVAAIGAHVERANEAFANINVPALITLFPGVRRDLELDSL